MCVCVNVNLVCYVRASLCLCCKCMHIWMCVFMCVCIFVRGIKCLCLRGLVFLCVCVCLGIGLCMCAKRYCTFQLTVPYDVWHEKSEMKIASLRHRRILQDEGKVDREYKHQTQSKQHILDFTHTKENQTNHMMRNKLGRPNPQSLGSRYRSTSSSSSHTHTNTDEWVTLSLNLPIRIGFCHENINCCDSI